MKAKTGKARSWYRPSLFAHQGQDIPTRFPCYQQDPICKILYPAPPIGSWDQPRGSRISSSLWSVWSKNGEAPAAWCNTWLDYPGISLDLLGMFSESRARPWTQLWCYGRTGPRQRPRFNLIWKVKPAQRRPRPDSPGPHEEELSLSKINQKYSIIREGLATPLPNSLPTKIKRAEY